MLPSLQEEEEETEEGGWRHRTCYTSGETQRGACFSLFSVASDIFLIGYLLAEISNTVTIPYLQDLIEIKARNETFWLGNAVRLLLQRARVPPLPVPRRKRSAALPVPPRRARGSAGSPVRRPTGTGRRGLDTAATAPSPVGCGLGRMEGSLFGALRLPATDLVMD